MFVVADAGFQDWLVGSATPAHDADHGARVAHHGFSGARRKTHSGFGTVFRMADDCGVTACGSGDISYYFNLIAYILT